MQQSAANGTELLASARRGSRAALLAQGAGQLASLATLAALYRLTQPADYGLLAAAMPAVMLPRMAATLGFQTAILQAPALAHQRLQALLGVQLLAGAAAAFVTVLMGFLLGWACQMPELPAVCGALAGCTLLVSLGNQHLALLERDLRISAVSGLRFAALALAAAPAIVVAARGGGVWALVTQQAVEIMVLTAGAWWLHAWRPWTPLAGAAEKPTGPAESLAELFRFSLWYAGGQLVNYLAQNLDKLLLPLALGALAKEPLGFFSQGLSLMLRPVYLTTTPLTGVMIRSLAAARDQPEEFQRLAGYFFRLAGLLLFPLAAGVWVVGEELPVALGGEKWRGTGQVLAILAPAIVGCGLANLTSFLLAAVGKARQMTISHGVLCLLLAQGMGAALWLARLLEPAPSPHISPLAVWLATAYTVVVACIWSPLFIWLSLGAAGVARFPVVLACWPAFRGALLMGILTYALQGLLLSAAIPPGVRLTACVLVGILAYALLAWRELRWLVTQFAGGELGSDARPPPARASRRRRRV